jgi:quinol monooxygenase YgiN
MGSAGMAAVSLVPPGQRNSGALCARRRAARDERVLTAGVTAPDEEPIGALLPGRVGLLVRLVCRPGGRTAALDVINRYMDVLSSEPGTEMFTVAVDPNEDDILWFYEWFTDDAALDAHRANPAFHELMSALPPVLAAAPALVRIDPLRMHLQRSVAEGHTVDRIF